MVCHVIVDVAVHVLVSLPLGVVVLGMTALHRSEVSVQGEVKAHPATRSPENPRN